MDELPISTNLNVQWSSWSFFLPSDCTFDTYQVTLTDPNGKELVFQYVDQGGGNFSKVPISETTPNLLDIFKDDPATLKVFVDDSSFDGKTSGLGLYGIYTIKIQGGDSRDCCDPTKFLSFTYELVNNCDQPTAIDFLDKDKLFVAQDTGLTITGEIQVDVSLYEDAASFRVDID